MPDTCLARFSTSRFPGSNCQCFAPVFVETNTGLLPAADFTWQLVSDSADRFPVAHPLLSKLGDRHD